MRAAASALVPGRFVASSPNAVLAKVSTLRYSASMPRVKFPPFDLPTFELPTFDLPTFDLPTFDIDAVAGAVKDAGYITVGLAVLAAQRAQVRRQELKKSLADQAGDGRSQIAEIVVGIEAGIASLDTHLIALEAKFDGAVEGLEQRLPERAGSLLGQVHEAAKVARQQVRNLINPAT